MMTRFSATSSAAGWLRRLGVAGSLLTFLAVAVAGCSGAAASPAPPLAMKVDCATFDSAVQAGQPLARDLAVTGGQTFAVILCSNASTGFAWEVPTWTGDPSVELLQRGDAAPATALPGAAGTAAFTFRATAAGTTVIEFIYSQPWAGGTKGAWQLALTVTVS